MDKLLENARASIVAKTQDLAKKLENKRRRSGGRSNGVQRAAKMTGLHAANVDVPMSAMAEAILSHAQERISQSSTIKGEEAGMRPSMTPRTPSKASTMDAEKSDEKGTVLQTEESRSSLESVAQNDQTHRRLRPRHIQLIGIGGTIGTGLFVSIGKGLMNGGPANLFLAFAIWCVFIVAVTVTMAEMVTYNPISSPFIRFASRYVDEAFGVATGYNFFIFEATLVPFEMVAANLIIKYWTDVIPDAAMLVLLLVLYAIINLFGVRAYGESEFWLAIGKVILIVGLLLYTLITMCGGNPLGDRYGFRYWNEPGAFAEYYETGSLGRFMGFVTCLSLAAFTVAGPDYVSMAAGETANPRVVLPKAFKAVGYRLTVFFVLGALAVGINVPYNDVDLGNAYAAGASGAKASPYVVGMYRLRVKVLPDIVNAMILASAFSAGNSYVYCASRCLYGLALEGKAPKFFRRCTPQGVPVYCVGVVLAFGCLSFMSLSNSAGVVLNWFVNLVTASQLINFTVMTFTFIKWKAACEAQMLDRNTLPYKSPWQPYTAYFALAGTGTMIFIGGYEVFLPGKWDVTTFIFSYCMVGVFPCVFLGWKLAKKTRWMGPTDIVLRTHEVVEIEEYTAAYVEPMMSPWEKVLHGIFG